MHLQMPDGSQATLFYAANNGSDNYVTFRLDAGSGTGASDPFG
jgi:hypothetical protein